MAQPTGNVSVKLLEVDVPYSATNVTLNDFYTFTEDATPQGFVIKEDGTKLIMYGSTNDTMYQYTLTTPYDITTVSYDSVSFYCGGTNIAPRSGSIVDGGKKLFVADPTDQIERYDMTSPWDLSTMSYHSAMAVTEQALLFGCHVSEDGTKVYAIGNDLDDIEEFTLSTPYDLSTHTWERRKVVGDTSPTHINFNPTGTKMFAWGNTGQDMHEWTLSTPWNISTAGSPTITGIARTSPCFQWAKGGAKLYIMDQLDDRIYEYDVGDAPSGTFYSQVT